MTPDSPFAGGSAWWCAHSETTPADEDGYAICCACGARIPTRLTPALLHSTFDALLRDHGRYGRHSRRCVNSDLGWVCADDCRMVRRT